MFARLRPWLAACSLGLSLLAPAALAAPAVKVENALLWKIEKRGVAPSWLYGMAHVADPRVAQFSPAMQDAFMSAKRIGTETKIDFNSLMELAKHMLTAEPSLKAKLGADYYAKLVPLLEARDYPEVATAKMKPWAAAMLILVPTKQKGQIPLDLLFSKMAIESQKDYFGLETTNEQLELFEKLTPAQQLTLLKATIDQQATLKQQYQQLIGLYLKQDINGLLAMASKEDPVLPAKDQGWYKAWQSKVLDGRNPRLAARIAKEANKGDAFIGIGALHLAGKDGVIQRLRRAGFKVTAVNPAR